MERLRRAALLLALLLSGAPPAIAAERGVAPGELAGALAAARLGDTLHLETGVHRGAFVIDRRLRLVGEPGATIAGPGEGDVLVLAADGIEVAGLTVRGSGKDLSHDDAVIRLREASGITVADCTVYARAFGIYLQAGGEHTIRGNVVHGDATLPSAERGNGIHLWNSVRNTVADNELVDTRDGVYLSFAHDNRIVANRASGVRYGIHYMYSERNDLFDNRFARCVGGIALMFSMKNRIARNVATTNRDFGILCQQIEHSQLEANVVAGNGRGFYVQNSADNRFVNNRIAENGVGVFLTAGSERNVFTENEFDRNLVQAYPGRAADNAWSDAGRGNRWSDYTGFDWNGDGVGETPYRLQTAASALLARRPEVRWFWMSPVLTLLDWWGNQVAAHDPYAFDRAPLTGAAGAPPPATADSSAS